MPGRSVFNNFRFPRNRETPWRAVFMYVADAYGSTMQQARYDSEPPMASQDSMIGLLKRAARDGIDLVQNEFALARAEAHTIVGTLKQTIAKMLIAATLLLAGGLAVIAALVLLLALWMPAWIAALGVGIVLLGIGAVVFANASTEVGARELDLPRTRDSLQQDLAVLKRDHGKPA